jgi:hypothetical protein
MMGMAQVSRSARERHSWLKRVLKLDPNNEVALKAMKKLRYRNASTENRTLLMFGVIVVVLIVLGVTVIVILQAVS